MTHATARWEQVLSWQRIFAPDSRLLAVTVHEGEHLRAALPLVQSRARKIVPVWRSLWSHWAWAGELLVDRCRRIPTRFSITWSMGFVHYAGHGFGLTQ